MTHTPLSSCNSIRRAGGRFSSSWDMRTFSVDSRGTHITDFWQRTAGELNKKSFYSARAEMDLLQASCRNPIQIRRDRWLLIGCWHMPTRREPNLVNLIFCNSAPGVIMSMPFLGLDPTILRSGQSNPSSKSRSSPNFVTVERKI